MRGKTLIVITGPTASGKSALAINVAKRLGSEIVNADSRQVYQGIPIATALPSIEEREGVEHRLLDFLPLDAYYSASLFEQDALKAVADIHRRNDVAIACGGSMLYVDALCQGIDELPTIPTQLREELQQAWQQRGDEWLREELRKVDRAYYELVDLRNLKRVIHALEITLAAGRPYTELRRGVREERQFRVLKYALTAPREVLFERINSRVERMIAAGLEEEARRVYPQRRHNSLNTVGLKEMFAYIEGTMDFDTARLRIGKNTRVYAKKQLTWYRRDAAIKWLDATNADKALAQIMRDVEGTETFATQQTL